MRRQPKKQKVVRPENGKLRKTFRFSQRTQGMLEILMQNPDAPQTENAMVQACIHMAFVAEMYSRGMIQQHPDYDAHMSSYKGKLLAESKASKVIEKSVEELADLD